MDRTLLTPAEAALLLKPSSSTASKCLQAGLLSLISIGRIAIEQPSGRFKQSALLLKGGGPQSAEHLPPHLKVVEDSLYADAKGNRLSSSEVLHALQKKFGDSFGRYVHEELAPGLIERELITRDESRLLGLFPRVSYQHTSRGAALTVQVQRLVEDVERVPSLIKTDPNQALNLALSAGVLLVMSDRARRQIPALRKLLEERREDSMPIAYTSSNSDEEGGGEIGHSLDFDEMALSFDIESLLNGIEAVGDFTSGADVSSADGGDGGGGGGGD